MFLGRSKRAVLLCAVAALLIVPASAGAVNPVSFSSVGNMTVKREYPGAARLPDGRILIVGGYNSVDLSLKSAEIFDPATNTFSAIGATMSVVRFAPAVARLGDGRILVAGGWDNNDDIASAEVFNPSTNTFSPVGSLAVPKEEATAVSLPDGRVLVAGGFASTSAVNTTELFNPQTNTFSPGPSMPGPTYGAAGAAISGGRSLIAGGVIDGAPDLFLNSAFVFNSSNSTFSTAGTLGTGRYAPAGSALPQGALAAGGDRGPFGTYLASAEIFDPTTNSFTSTGVGNLATARREAAGAILPDGRALVAGGFNDDGALASAEVLSVPSNAFNAKLKGNKVIFEVSNEGVATTTDTSNKPATIAKKKKPKLVKTKSKHGGPGKIKVKVKLTKAGSAKLSQRGKLTIRITYTPDRGLAATRKLKLRAGK